MFSIKTKMTGSSYLHTQEINITFKCVGESIITAMNVVPTDDQFLEFIRDHKC